MNLTELQNSIRTLGAEIRNDATALATAAAGGSVSTDELTRQRVALTDKQNRMASLQTALNVQQADEAGGLPASAATGADDKPGLSAMLKSNEYARAFAYALRNGLTPKKGRMDQKCAPLYNALTIAGGDPAGEDGGFLVPEDVDRQIRELKRQLSPLSELFSIEDVGSNSGWRVSDAAPTTGFTQLDGEIPAAGIPTDDQPVFAQVTYALNTYGLIIPVSNQLVSDEVANLFGYLARWFAKKQVITENLLLKAKLELLTPANILTTDSPIDAIKSVLNLSLDPAISENAVILTNQSGFNYLDQLTDGLGRSLMQPDPVTGTPMMFKNRRVKMMSDKIFPNRKVTTAGATKGDYYPIYVGDFAQYATLFMRQPLEVSSTDIGGDAWRKNATEVRGIVRMNASVFDAEAAVRREIFIPAS